MKNTDRQFQEEQLSRRRGAWLLLLVLLLVAIPAVGVLFPRRVTSADAPADQFSGERAMSHLAMIASVPHPQGSPAQARVREYLAGQLTGMGLEVEIQQARGVENVVAQLPGSNPSGTILILSHYDSANRSPGAGDNGSGVCALLEVLRALVDGPAPRNNILALFDDGEELPDPFSGAKAFVTKSPWMPDVRVAISLDTAVAGTISINESGPENGWLMAALDRSFTGGAWTSMSGGGNYDSTPFRNAGILILALESNYPFWQKHTSKDLPEIVRPASVQQMGEQTLAIARELGELDLKDPRGKQETFFSLPLLGFAHYPESWAAWLAIYAGILFAVALILAFRAHWVSLKGLSISLGSILATAALSAIGTGSVWPHLPELTGWETSRWPDWPEVIPPYGGVIDMVFALLIFGLAVVGYVFARRWSTRVDYALAGLAPFLLVAVATGFAFPRGAYIFTWPVMISSLGWIVGFFARRKSKRWSVDLALTGAATMMIVFILPFLPGIVMADGMKSLAILAGVEALILGVILPVADSLLVRQFAQPLPGEGNSTLPSLG